ncbi:MAG: hypothetical protein H0X64_15205 [Gemmatimonadaceae bacterium]|nr:hypothetical protein [Gemmatimonadaceae bacterium]
MSQPLDRPPRRRLTAGRLLIAAVVVWCLARFTEPGRFLVEIAWDVVSARLFWTVAFYIGAGYLALIVVLLVVLKLGRATGRVARAGGRGATQVRQAGEQVRARRERRCHDVDDPERDEFESTLSDIRNLPEAEHHER